MMLKNITFCLSLLFTNMTSAADKLSPVEQELVESYFNNASMEFANIEHRQFGDNVLIKLPTNPAGQKSIKLQLPNGLALSYGEIVMFGGDMFGDPNFPISSCKEKEQKSCFNKQFYPLGELKLESTAGCSNPQTQTSKLNAYFKQLEQRLEEARLQGQTDWEFYDTVAFEINKELNQRTCGGSVLSKLFPFGSYLKLAQVNFDHFVPDSLTAYQAGHGVALKIARLAFMAWHDEQNSEKALNLLHHAYAKNAFASHYLTDSMSSGHMRTPRRPLYNQSFLPKILKLLVANLMHNEDNQLGLQVVNSQGTSWLAFGDGHFYKPEAFMHRIMMRKVMQQSADAIFDTFQTGKIPSQYPEMALLPDYSKIGQLNTSAPLFKVINHIVQRRRDIDDTHAASWTPFWSGIGLLLRKQL